eukprot:1062440-Prorocentrum_lima.AAC.1
MLPMVPEPQWVTSHSDNEKWLLSHTSMSFPSLPTRGASRARVKKRVGAARRLRNCSTTIESGFLNGEPRLYSGPGPLRLLRRSTAGTFLRPPR